VITPDTKDWTWVVERECPECGFDASRTRPQEVPGLIRDNAAGWRRLLDEGRLRPGRPDDSTWSSLEYACHVRDVYRLYLERLVLMLETDDPLFANWDQDETAVADRYDEQDPPTAVAELMDAAELLAVRIDRVEDEQWTRPGRRSDGANFTVGTLVRYMAHDPIHHIWDVERQVGEAPPG
jgi:hypothetical protein